MGSISLAEISAEIKGDNVIARKNDHSLKNAELQWNICDDMGKTLKALQFKANKQISREVIFQDTPNLALLSQDAVIRYRESQKNGSGSVIERTVKLRNVDIKKIPWKILDQLDSKCEWDIHSQVERLSCSMNQVVNSISEPLSSLEKDLINERMPLPSSLGHWGPVDNWSQKGSIFLSLDSKEKKEPEWELKAELSRYTIQRLGEDLQILELSIPTSLSDFGKIQRKMEEFFSDQKIKLCSDQRGITEPLLQALSESH